MTLFLKPLFSVLIPALLISTHIKANEEPVLIDGIVAVVNGKPVIHRNVIESLKMRTNNGWRNMPLNMKQEAYKKELNSVIENLLVEEFLVQSKFDISGSQVDQYFKNLAKQNNLSVDQFKNALKSQNIDESQFRINIKRQLQRSKIFQLLRSRVHVDDNEAKEFYKQKSFELNKDEFLVRASHILLKVKKDAPIEKVSAVYKKIESAYNKLKSSTNLIESWKKQSAELSEAENAKAGGDLGFFGKGEILKQISDTAYDLKKGEISKPFRTQLGFHILYVTDSKPKDIADFDKVKNNIKQSLMMRKLEEKFKDWIKEQKQVFAVKSWPISEDYIR